MVDGLVVPSTPSRVPWSTELSTSPRYIRNAQTDEVIMPGNMNIRSIDSFKFKKRKV